MQPAIKFEDNVGLVHLQAKHGLHWAKGAGAALDYEDMYQIASEAFLVAAQGYDPDAGYKFSAYYTMTAFSHFRKEIGLMTGVKNINAGQKAEIIERKEENARRRAAGVAELPDIRYGVRTTSFTDMNRDGEDADPFEQTLACDAMTPEEALEFKQVWAEITGNLSPLAALIVEWLRDPPAALLDELRKQEAYAGEADKVGKRTYGLREGVTIKAIGKFVRLVSDVPRGELIKAEVELEKVVEAIEGIYGK